MWDKIGDVLRTSWDFHPTLIAAIGGLSPVYIAGGFDRRPRGYRPPTGQGVMFAIDILTLIATLQSPLHHLADADLYSAHMVQHLVLTLVVPPLLLLGTPGWL